MSTLLKDLIHIPTTTGDEDYVLRLTDSVGTESAVASTLDDYVVTDKIRDAFSSALNLVAEAITTDTSKGAFLAGSFGSGKSHFMAVLHAILRHEPLARKKTELQGVITQYDPQLREKNILPLAFHLLGANTMEEALFSGYIRQIQELHPGTTLPALHDSDNLLVDAEQMRTRLGDDAFFAGLGGGEDATGDDPWGSVVGTGTWDTERYSRARAASPDSEIRRELVTALVENYFPSYTRQAEYVDIDTGLQEIADHAALLGYDAVVLFLDELVLWLAFAVNDAAFFRRESQKLTKLVESSIGHRRIPLISFIARQMDLRQWFAEAGSTGAEQEALDRAFNHQSGRFSEVTLGDDNLAHVAHQRLLKPKDAEAERIINEAFDRLERRPEVWDVLLDGINTDEEHRGADEAAFRLTYPFSPALISTLRSLAGVMQRERTALKVMQQMLVDRRDELTVDDLIPVGDAFSYLVSGQDPLDSAYSALFRAGRSLYGDKFLPLIRETHNLSAADMSAGGAVPRGYAMDDRLAKTLLLSAIARDVPALRDLTTTRLASLNHGSITTPLPGNEASVVRAKINTWRSTIPELHMIEDAVDPVVRVQLDDVDYESIVQKAKREDNPARRLEMVKKLLVESLGIDLSQEQMYGVHTHSIIWRGTTREVDVLFGNVRDAAWLTDDHFASRPNVWRVIIDHPFDDATHSRADDYQRVDRFLAGGESHQTLVWLPRFFSETTMKDLRRLVVLDWFFSGDEGRWRQYADHLSETDRVVARSILEGQHTALRNKITGALAQAYGIHRPAPGVLLDEGVADRLIISLDRGFDPGTLRQTSFPDAYGNLLERAYAATFPGHPEFQPGDEPITRRDLRAVHEYLLRAAEHPEKRVLIESNSTALSRIAGPLGVATAAETHFILGDDRFRWGPALARALGRADITDAPVTAGDLRSMINAVTPPHGLTTEMTDLIITTWALLRQRAWYLNGAPIDPPEPGRVDRTMELRREPLPTPEEWSRGIESAGQLFDLHTAPQLTPARLNAFVTDVREKADELAPAARALTAALREAYPHLVEHGGSANSTDRLATAERGAELVAALRQLKGVQLVQRLGTVRDDAATLGTSLSYAASVTDALERFEWDRLSPAQQAAPSDAEAAQILGDLNSALAADEIVTQAGRALQTAENAVFTWLGRRASPTPPPAPAPPAPPVAPATADDVEITLPDADYQLAGGRELTAGEASEALTELRAFLEENSGREVAVRWWVKE